VRTHLGKTFLAWCSQPMLLKREKNNTQIIMDGLS
jgi:hypothetical protein